MVFQTCKTPVGFPLVEAKRTTRSQRIRPESRRHRSRTTLPAWGLGSGHFPGMTVKSPTARRSQEGSEPPPKQNKTPYPAGVYETSETVGSYQAGGARRCSTWRAHRDCQLLLYTIKVMWARKLSFLRRNLIQEREGLMRRKENSLNLSQSPPPFHQRRGFSMKGKHGSWEAVDSS